jgi:2-succinyl-6-hydroxy-2,4-cyclohexadiene-1-carboxylate synthase
MTRIDVGGHALHVEEHGSGSPLLLLHGFTGSTETLRDTAERLAAQHRVVAVDLPGHGRSDAPDDIAAYGMEACAEQLATVLERLGIERTHLLGYSMGGRVALGLVALQPARVRSAILVGASAGLADPEARAARLRSDAALADELLTRGLEPFVERWMALPLFRSQWERLGPEHREAARKQRLRNRSESLARSLRGCGTGAQPPLHERLGRVTAPVLLCAGDEDVKFCEIARDLAERLPRGRLCTIPRAGHACHLENPSAFADAALSFLRETDAETSPPTTQE